MITRGVLVRRENGQGGDIATKLFEFLPLIGDHTPVIGMQAKPLGTDTALRWQRLLTGDAQPGVFSHVSTFCPAPGPKGNAVGAGGRVRLCKAHSPKI